MSDRTRCVFLIFVWTRLAIWLAAVFALLAFPPVHRDDPTRLHDLGFATDVWARWDSWWFVRIAQHGYDFRDAAPAFYPLYPGAMAVVSRVLVGHYVLGGVITSLAATLVAFVLLAQLGELLLDRTTALRAVLYLAIFPMTLFLQAVYSESLFLMLAVATFLAAEHRRWLIVGPLAGLALLTRPTGIAVVAGVAVLAWRARSRLRAFASLALAVPVFAAFPLVLAIERGEPFAFVHVERLWYREPATLGPLGGLWEAIHAAWASILQLVVGSAAHPYWVRETPDRFAAWNLENTAFFILYVVLAILAWRRLGAAYGTYCAVSLALPLSATTHAQPLLSMPRFGVVLFPLFLALATLGDDQRVDRAIVGISSVLLGVATTEWALWLWVS